MTSNKAKIHNHRNMYRRYNIRKGRLEIFGVSQKAQAFFRDRLLCSIVLFWMNIDFSEYAQMHNEYGVSLSALSKWVKHLRK